jgi:hypothetical protein
MSTTKLYDNLQEKKKKKKKLYDNLIFVGGVGYTDSNHTYSVSILPASQFYQPETTILCQPNLFTSDYHEKSLEACSADVEHQQYL